MNPLFDVYSMVSKNVCRFQAARAGRGPIARHRAPLPVISVGNLALGGSEKTPLVVELLTAISGLGLKPAFVSRGYRGRWEHTGGTVSDGKALLGGWKEAGDEAFMVARRFPEAGVFVGRDRLRSCLRASKVGCDIAVLDDGFQYFALGRDLNIVLHDPERKGPLREGIPALKRADILLLKEPGAAAFQRKWTGEFPGLEIFDYRVLFRGILSLDSGESVTPESLGARKILAFCGIARPVRFFSLLERSGISPRSRLAFPDHFPYPGRALARIASACRAAGIEALVTTEKDAVKIGDRREALGRLPIYILSVGLDLPGEFFGRVKEKISEALKTRGTGDPRHE